MVIIGRIYQSIADTTARQVFMFILRTATIFMGVTLCFPFMLGLLAGKIRNTLDLLVIALIYCVSTSVMFAAIGVWVNSFTPVFEGLVVTEREITFAILLDAGAFLCGILTMKGHIAFPATIKHARFTLPVIWIVASLIIAIFSFAQFIILSDIALPLEAFANWYQLLMDATPEQQEMINQILKDKAAS